MDMSIWEGACAGDPRFDLVRFAYDLDGHDQPVWDVVEATGIERRVLRAYVLGDGGSGERAGGA
jgi:hypothetical protein